MALSRKQSREVAYKLLFSLAQPTDDMLEVTCVNEKPQGPELEFVKKLCTAALDNIDEIDEIIKAHSHSFSFDRIYKTDLTALRMGIAEIKFFDGTPHVVAINAAVEIAKKYGTEKSGGFVNGILAAVLKGNK